MKRPIGLLLALVLAVPAFAQTSLPCSGRDWTLAYAPYGTANPSSLSGGGCISFQLPPSTAGHGFKKVAKFLGYVTTGAGPTDLTPFTSVSMTFDLIETGTPVFNAPSEGCVAPVAVRLFFGVSPNDPTYNSTGRWWLNAPGGSVQLEGLTSGQSVVLVGALNPADWSDAIGELANQDSTTLAGFQYAEQNVASIGFTFGGCFFGHGVQVSDGTAQFNLFSAQLQ